MWSENIKKLKMVVTLVCIGLISIFVFSCGGSSGGDDNGANNTPQTYTASGNYSYNPDTGMLVLTFVLSDFLPSCGPEVGDEIQDVDSITATTMHWVGDDMTWTRDSGTADDILGTWEYTDEDGNAYEVTFNNNFSMDVVGEIIDCDDSNGGYQSDTITGESGSPVSVTGNWEGICDPDSNDGSSEMSILSILLPAFTVTSNHWFNSMTCSGASDATQVISGTVTTGNEVTANLDGSNVTATKIDIVINSATATINNPAILADINADQECGFNNWVVGTPKNIMGTSCLSQANQKDIIYIDDTDNPDTLYFGEEDGPFDTNGYPTVIDLDSEAERM